MPIADVSDVYTDLVTTVFSSTIAAKAWFATAVDTTMRFVSGQEEADVVPYVVSISSSVE